MTFSYLVCHMSYTTLLAAAAPGGGIGSILLAGATMVGLGGGFALVLLIASEKLKVEVDPKIEQIHEALPSLDCGACGYAGCGQNTLTAVNINPSYATSLNIADRIIFYFHRNTRICIG